MTRVIAIPPFFIPGTTQISPTSVAFELVNALGQSISGMALDHGIAGRKQITATDAEQLLELEVNADIVPFSQWRVTLTSGLVQQTVMVTLSAWEGAPSDEVPLPLADMLYPTS